MLNFLKKYAGLLYVAVATLIVLILVMNSGELPQTLRAFGSLDVRWVWGCAACIALYLTARALTLMFYLRREGVRIRLVDALIVTGVGQFYSAITPSSSGGQPMQVISMHQMGVPVSTATATVSVKYVGFQLSFMLIGIIMWALNVHMVAEQLGGVRYLVLLGYLVNAVLMVGVGLTMVRSRLIDRAVDWCVRKAARMRLVKDEQRAREKAFSMLNEYQSALKRLIDRPLDALVVLLLSCAQIICLMSVTGCLYHAFGMKGYTGSELFTLQILLFITAAFVPLPGAAGAQEGGFYLFFQGIFEQGDILAAMLCWRLFTYYLLMFSGLVAVVANAIRRWCARRRGEPDGA